VATGWQGERPEQDVGNTVEHLAEISGFVPRRSERTSKPEDAPCRWSERSESLAVEAGIRILKFGVSK